MSKKKKWKRKNRRRSIRPAPLKLRRSVNRHHLLFQGRHWITYYAKQLRTVMVREIPVNIHNKLHNDILHDVPKPDEKTLRIAYNAYLDQKTIVDTLDICQLILWLCDEIPDEAFRACMMKQYAFFRSELMGGLD